MITKEKVIDRIEIVGPFKHIQIREATILKENGKEIGRSNHRRVLDAESEVTNESKEIKDISAVVWTPAVKTAFKAAIND